MRIAAPWHGHRHSRKRSDNEAPVTKCRWRTVPPVGMNRASALHVAANEFVQAAADHGTPQLVQPRPGGGVAAQPQHLLYMGCTRPVLLARHVPHGTKPKLQRFPNVLKDRSGRYRQLVTAAAAHDASPARGPPLRRPAPGAFKSVRPAEISQVFPAGSLTQILSLDVVLFKGGRSGSEAGMFRDRCQH